MKDPELKGWIRIDSKKPSSERSYFISGHEWFGIAYWTDEKGWSDGFLGEFPCDRGTIVPDLFLNQETMWYKEIMDYPYCGNMMCDCPEYEKYWKD